LPVGGIDSAASRLFLERARNVKPEFGEGAESAAAVAEICRRLDGLPLAIELAAARARVLSPQAMLARLDRRLTLLTGGAQDLPERQRTMRAAIDWSHDLLDPSERALYRRLAVFRGGFGLDAAEKVAGGRDIPDVLEGISSLVGRSLLRAGDAEGEPWFSMLATVQEHAIERLDESGEAPVVAERHARHYAGLVEGTERQIQTRERRRWLGRLDVESDNLRAACDWGLGQDPALGLQTAKDLIWFWYLTGRGAESFIRMSAAVTVAEGKVDDHAYAQGMCALGMSALSAGDLQYATDTLDRACVLLARHHDAGWLGRATSYRGLLAHIAGDRRAALGFLDEGLTLLRQSGHRWHEAQTLMFVGDCRLAMGDAEEAEAKYRESLAIFEAVGDPSGRARVLNGLSDLAASVGDFAAAYARAVEAETLVRQLIDNFALATALSSRGNAAIALGDIADGERSLREALVLWQTHGYRPMTWLCLAGLAAAALATGRTERARALWTPVRQQLVDSHGAIPGGGLWHRPRYRTALDEACGTSTAGDTVDSAVARALRDD
jgi:tetratricopeptide (TPR) repeat protein